MMRKRIIAIIAAALAIVILGVSLSAVLEYVDTIEFVDVDGTKYYAKNKDDVYKLYAKGSKEPLPTDGQYGYYVTKIGTLVKLDATTGLATEYIPVETEGNENVGFNDRVLIFPHIEKKNILSLEVHNEYTPNCRPLTTRSSPSPTPPWWPVILSTILLPVHAVWM